MKTNVVVVAHHERRAAARKLADTVGADHVCMDNGDLGVNANHRAAWAWHLSHPADWAIVLEDDSVPCKEFRWQLTQALTVAPATVVSLYLGKMYPPSWQETLEYATKRAEKADACFIVGPYNFHAVGLAANRAQVKHLLAGMTTYGVYAVDMAICTWAEKANVEIAYTWPSLVDHADGPSVVKPLHDEPRLPGRVAWKHGTRKKWNHTSVPLITHGGVPV